MHVYSLICKNPVTFFFPTRVVVVGLGEIRSGVGVGIGVGVVMVVVVEEVGVVLVMLVEA